MNTSSWFRNGIQHSESSQNESSWGRSEFRFLRKYTPLEVRVRIEVTYFAYFEHFCDVYSKKRSDLNRSEQAFNHSPPPSQYLAITSPKCKKQRLACFNKRIRWKRFCFLLFTHTCLARLSIPPIQTTLLTHPPCTTHPEKMCLIEVWGWL